MKSTLKFSISPEGERSMQPVILAHIYHSDDARDSVANHFSYRMGLNHNFLVWERIPEMSLNVEENFHGQYCIKNFKPDADLVVLNCTEVQNKEGFISEVRGLIEKYSAIAEWLPNAAHLPLPGHVANTI